MPNDYGLRRVIANGKAGDALWAHDQRRVQNAGLVHHDTNADVSVLDCILNTYQCGTAAMPTMLGQVLLQMGQPLKRERRDVQKSGS